MKKLNLSPVERFAFALALGLILFMAGWFARGAVTSPGTYAISVSQPSSAPTPSPSAQTFTPDTLVDLNSATLAELTTLPGIGEAKAQAILDYRSDHGPFRAVTDLLKVSGIGQSTFTALKDYITISTP